MLCQAWSKRMLDTHRPVYGDDLQPMWSSFCDAPWLKTWWWGIHQHVLYVPWSMDLSPHFMGISWDINGISMGYHGDLDGISPPTTIEGWMTPYDTPRSRRHDPNPKYPKAMKMMYEAGGDMCQKEVRLVKCPTFILFPGRFGWRWVRLGRFHDFIGWYKTNNKWRKKPVGIVYGIVHTKNIKIWYGFVKNGEVTFKLWRGWWWKWFSQPRDFGVFCVPQFSDKPS